MMGFVYKRLICVDRVKTHFQKQNRVRSWGSSLRLNPDSLRLRPGSLTPEWSGPLRNIPDPGESRFPHSGFVRTTPEYSGPGPESRFPHSGIVRTGPEYSGVTSAPDSDHSGIFRTHSPCPILKLPSSPEYSGAHFYGLFVFQENV